MKDNENDIFKSLNEKLDQKEFDYNPAHWEAAKELIPKKPGGIFNLGPIASISGIIITLTTLSYFLLEDDAQPIEDTPITNVENISTEKNTEPLLTQQQEIENVDFISEKSTPEKVNTTTLPESNELNTNTEKEIVTNSEDSQSDNAISTSSNNTDEPITSLTEEEYNEYNNLTNQDFRNRTNHNNSIEDADENSNEEPVSEPNDNNIIVPNIFTPNNDGISDLFVIENLMQSDNWQLYIFNKDNSIVYQSENYDNKWSGEGIPDGIYIYKLYNKGLDYTKVGSLTIKR